ncbi:MAG: hypothetical protein EB021_12745, partial [Gammaproteobacteria bacterium]|nr:hypothetical protein [Gammaproteobacteria bacterium]
MLRKKPLTRLSHLLKLLWKRQQRRQQRLLQPLRQPLDRPKRSRCRLLQKRRRRHKEPPKRQLKLYGLRLPQPKQFRRLKRKL